MPSRKNCPQRARDGLASDFPVKVMSFNIWSDAPRNASWKGRRDRLADLLAKAELDLIGIQEATLSTIQDLRERLGGFAWIGHGRDDGREGGEFTPIFFRSDRFRLLEHATFWLAAVCDLPGRGWDAFCSRTVTWGRFEDLEHGRQCIVFNTHLDHLGRRARLQSALLLLAKIREIGGGEPVVVTGDFNCRESSAPYRTLTGKIPFSGLEEGPGFLRDAMYESEQPPQGPRKTYRGWMSLFGIGRIDYIFVKNAFRTLRHVVLDDRPPVSDHRAVLAELEYAAPNS
jgi:endonuclease/exonuclease/phosphatase family metal-dependent hydrolase